jgi:hypothetical protein
MIIHRIIVPLILLMAVAAMGQAGIVKASDGQGQGWDGAGCCGGGGYENNYLQGANGYNAGISDAVYDHNNGLAYNPVGNCLPCHSQVYWDGFRHGHDTAVGVMSVGKLIRKGDGPQEVEWMINTMTKYGGKSEA